MIFSRKTLCFIIILTMLSTVLPAGNAIGAGLGCTLVSSDGRVQINDGYVSVYSHPTDRGRYVSSQMLLSYVSCDGGCTLAYADTKRKETSSSDVKDGFIVHKTSSGNVYIPISKRGETIANRFGYYSDGSKVYTDIRDSAVTYTMDKGGVGGKSSLDTASVFEVKNGSGTGANSSMTRYRGVASSSPYTFEVSAYVSGDARMYINFKYPDIRTYTLLSIDADGTVRYNFDDSSSATPFAMKTWEQKVEAAEWHRIAVSYDMPRMRYRIYINGTMITDFTECVGQNVASELCFGIGPESTNGIVAFDGLSAYYGYYWQGNYCEPSNLPSVIYDKASGRLCYDASVYATPSAVAAEVGAVGEWSSSYAYADSSMTSIATSFTPDTVIALTTPDGSDVMQYKLSDYIMYRDSDRVVGKSSLSISPNHLLVLASRRGNVITGVDVAYGRDGASLAYSDGESYTLYLWERDSLAPVYSPLTSDVNIFDYASGIGQDVIFNTDFEDDLPLNVYINYGNYIEREAEEGKNNTVVHIKRGNTSDFHLTGTGMGSAASDAVVYEFDLKVADENTVFNLTFKDVEAKEALFGYLTKGAKWCFGDKSVELGLNKWNTIAVVLNRAKRTAEYFVNGHKYGEEVMKSGFAVNTPVDLMRFHMTIYSPGGTHASWSDPIDFYVDNLRVYEAGAPHINVGEQSGKIRFTGSTIFPDETPVKAMLNGNIAIHTRSGVVFDGSQKYLMANAPYTANGEYYVHGGELDSILGKNSGISGYTTVRTYASRIGLSVVTDAGCINSGLNVLSSGGYSLPSDETQLQTLNDYVYNFRPSPDTVAAYYRQSSVYGEHPRIQATKADFERIKAQRLTDSTTDAWAKKVITYADALIGAAALKYELRDGIRLLGVSRDVLYRMYVLGMAYQLTGNKKYAVQAYVDLESVCSVFPDWHPIHDIDLGEMAAAVSIGYDWMYDAFTSEQRKVIEEGIYRNGLYDGCEGYQSFNAPTGGYSLTSDNHNVVTNGGLCMLALAFMDVYPTECAFVVSNAVRSVDNLLYRFAPDGAWYEGPHYWEYTMQYTSKILSSLESALGTAFGLDTGDGLSKSAEFMLYLQSGQGIFSYGDAIVMSVYPPEILWLSHKYQNKGIARALTEITNKTFYDAEAYAIALLWYRSDEAQESVELSLDKLYGGENVVVMRDSWHKKNPAFVGVHAGETNVSHAQLDGGSFIYDYGGIRWAKDPGMHNYNVTGYWDSNGDNGKRWQYFMSRAEAHNTLVVNPGALSDHYTDSFAALTLVASETEGAIATVDMTQLLHDVSSAKRGIMFTDNRTSIVVRDQVNLTKNSDVYWFMMTDADVSCDATGATLTSGNKTVRLDFVSDASAVISCAKAQPLPTSPTPADNGMPDCNRIMIKFSGSGRLNLTVKLTPADINGTPVSSYHKDIAQWSLNQK